MSQEEEEAGWLLWAILHTQTPPGHVLGAPTCVDLAFLCAGALNGMVNVKNTRDLLMCNLTPQSDVVIQEGL